MPSKDRTEERKASDFIFLQPSKKPSLTDSKKKPAYHIGSLVVEDSHEKTCYIKGYN